MTKVWVSNAGEEKAYQSILDSLTKLRTDYIDLLLIHQAYNEWLEPVSDEQYDRLKEPTIIKPTADRHGV